MMEGNNNSTVLYSVQQAAAKLGVAPKWLYERTRINAIPYRRLGRYVRFAESDLETIIRNAEVPVNTATSANAHNGSNGKEHPQTRP